MSGMENGVNTVTLRVNRFAPRAERARDRERGGSPFARKKLSVWGFRHVGAPPPARQAVVAGLHVERASGRHGA